MVIDDKDMGLGLAEDLLHVTETQLEGEQTLLVGERPDGTGVHLYQVTEDRVKGLVCATYSMAGELTYHERGPSISMRAFKPSVKAELDSLSGYAEKVITRNGIGVTRCQEVNKPRSQSSPFSGPVLTDLTLTPPF